MESWKGHGYAIRDYFEGDEKAEIIIHSSEGDYENIEVSLFFREFPCIPLIEKAALDLCYGDVIDIGAGTGCHALELQNRGLQTTAIDILPEAVDVMKKRGLRDARVADFREIQDEKFDTVLMLMNGIGIVGDLAGFDGFLKQVGGLVKPGGQVVFDSIDLREEEPSNIRYETVKKTDSDVCKNKKHYRGEIEYRIEYKGITYPPFKWLFIDKETVRDVSACYGWGFEKIMDYENGRYLGRIYR